MLVLEAGRPDYSWDPFIHMPAALAFPIGNKRYDWMYESEPEPHMHGRRIYHARGKVLGGSSSINGMIFQRGNPLDFERWAGDDGMESWDYAHCLPYFKRMETCLAGADVYRGASGPLVLERGPGGDAALRRLLRGRAAGGLSADERRQRAAAGRLREVRPHDPSRPPAERRARVPASGDEASEPRGALPHVRRTASCSRATRAVGVEVGGEIIRAGEVILCGGAINSPQLLQLSGVGNAAELSALGVDVVHDLPGVGEHLQDHLEVYVQYACTQPVSVQPALKKWKRPLIGAQWLFLRSGPGATNHFEAGGFIRSNDDVAYPNLMFHFLPVAIRYDGTSPGGDHGYQVHVGPMYSDARGSVKITSTDPREHPALRFNYLSTDQDRREWVEAVRCARKILNQPAFDPYSGGETSPGPDVATDEEILDWVARDAETALHPSCTCRMGVDEHVGRRPVDDACARPRRLAGRRRLGVPVRHQRQHLRAGDDGRGEGCRPDPRRHAAARRERRLLPASGGTC